MGKKLENRLKNVLTVIGWIVIVFAVIALVLFILRSGVLGS